MRYPLLVAGWILLGFGLSIPSAFAVHPADGRRSELIGLLERARDQTNIRSAGSSPFRLVAGVQLQDINDKPAEGTYTLIWQSPSSWRDDLQFRGFSQVRIADGERLYLSRTPPSLFPAVSELLQLLEFPVNLRLAPKSKVDDLREKTGGKGGERRIDFRTNNTNKSVYLNSRSGFPVRVEVSEAWTKSTYRFDEVIEFAGRQFPRLLTKKSEGRAELRAEVQSLTEEQPDTKTLAPPSDARWMPWCPEPVAAKLLNPAGLIAMPLPSGVTPTPGAIYGIVGPDGRWHNLTVVKSAGKDSDDHMLKMLGQLRFAPATCGTIPIPEERVIETR